MMSGCSSPAPDDSMKALELCTSMWSLILSHCPGKEVGEVRRVLGASLIEQAADLREEVTTLLEIWRQYHKDQINNPLPLRQLAEPPQLRQRLIQEIIFLVDHLKKKSKCNLIEQDQNRGILLYVESERSGHSSYNSGVSVGSGVWSCEGVRGSSCPPSTASSLDGQKTPLRPLTPSSKDRRQVSSLMEKSECINALDVDLIISHLRETLREECVQYQRDIEFLQSCLEKEHSSTEQHGVIKPTITELRAFGTQLEHTLLENSQTKTTSPPLQGHPPSKLPPLAVRHPHPPSTPSHGSQPLASRASQIRRKPPKNERLECQTERDQTSTVHSSQLPSTHTHCRNERKSQECKHKVSNGSETLCLHQDDQLGNILQTEVCDHRSSDSSVSGSQLISTFQSLQIAHNMSSVNVT